MREVPGPRSAAVLATLTDSPTENLLGPQGPLSEIVDVVMAGRRLEGWALWCQLSAIGRLLRHWTEQPPGDEPEDRSEGAASLEDCDPALAARLDRRLEAAQQRARFRVPRAADLVDDFVAAEVSLACGLSRPAADARVLAAQVLVLGRTLPRTSRLLRAGLLDWPKVQLLTTRLGFVEPALAAMVEAVLVPDADLAVADDVEVDVRADPVHPGAILPGVTRMTVPALAQAIEATILALDAETAATRATEARERRQVTTRVDQDGMGRLEASAGQEHVTAMWNALTAAAHRAKKAGDTRTVDQLRLDELLRRVNGQVASTGDAGAGDATEGRHDDARPVTAVSLTMPLATFLGLADDPGMLDGYGPIAAGLARRIAADAADAAQAHPSTTSWRCVVVDGEHHSVVGIGRPIRTPRHDPPRPLAALVRAGTARCVFPGCRVAARRCDLDHRVPYDHEDPDRGGPTCSCNLQPLCRTHHRLKTTGLIKVEPADGPLGTLEWTTRAGLRYRSDPEPVTPPPAPAGLRDLVESLLRERRRDAGQLAWMNAALRGAYTRGRVQARREVQADLADELQAELRHHRYGELLERSGGPEDREEPEDLRPVRQPRWMDRVVWGDPQEEPEPLP